MSKRSAALAFGTFTAALMIGCGPRTRNETGAAGNADTGMAMPDTSMRPGGEAGRTDTGTDTGTGGYDTAGRTSGGARDTGWHRSDSGHFDSGRSSRDTSDSARSNQTKSGVTDTRTGKSTLGTGVNKTRPDQGAPVTSKGDTLRSGGDSVGR